eukprot:3888229-Pleurochrysis_carterae.AAC.1
MFTHLDLARLATTAGIHCIFFEQSTFGASSPKTKQLIADCELLQNLSPMFSEKFCDHPPSTHNSIVGKSADGETYKTKSAQANRRGGARPTMIMRLK